MDELLIPVFVLSALSLPLLALALLLYAVPVRASARLVLGEDRKEQMLVIAWGIFGIRTAHRDAGMVTEMLILDRTVFSHTLSPASRGKEGEEDPPVGEGPEPVREAGRTGVALDTGGITRIVQAVLGPAGTFGSAIWKECRFEEARGRVRLGLGDPVLTGECCGLYWASRFVLEAYRIYLDFEPDFDRQVLELDVTVKAKVRHPLRILVAGLQLALHPAVHDAVASIQRQSRGVPAA
jgi:hypothetical protein